MTVAENTEAQGDETPDLNHAYFHGTEPEGLGDFLEREATFLLGQMYGQRDRRNTQDGDWQSLTLTWGAWIGGQAGSKVEPAWGFSRHPVGKDKAGASIVLGSSIGGARKAKAMDTMYAMGLDVDSGASLDDTLDRVEGLGLLCFVYTSFNHGKTGLELKRDDVLRKLDLSRDPTDEEIRVFLRDHDKHRYEESFIAGCTIKEQKHQTTEGVKIILDTPPLEKFRLIFPLAEPVKLIDLADTQQAALDLWEDKITGLARNTLGVHFDTSCTDPSRLFYTARHPKESKDWYAAIIMGNPLAFDSIKPMRKAAYTGNRDSNAFTQAGGETEGNRPPECLTPSGSSLNDWHRHAKDRFMIADLLETLCPDKIRVAGGEAQGHVHIECPFEHEHSEEGGTATMAVNCVDSQNEYWTWFCHHDACQGRHKLEFLEEALRAGWFDESELTNLDSGYLLEVADGEPDPLAPIPAELDDAEMTPVQRAAQLTREHDEETIRKFIKKLWREGADKTVRGNVNDVIAKNTAMTKHDLKPIWKELDAEARKTTQEGEFPEGILTTAPAPELTQYAADAVKAANEKTPFLFEYMEEPTIVRRGRIKALDRPGKRHALSKVTVFQKPKGEGELQHVYPPYDVVDDLFSSDLSDFCLPLRGAVDTPFFAADGALVTDTGYHAGSQMYLDSEMVLDRVSGAPSAEEAQNAARFIVEECLADFPLGGLTRGEIMAQTFTPSGVPAVANALSFILLHFARNMIHGATPGHVVNKPAPGTGAGYLVDVCTTIRSGAPAPALPMPKNKDELAKTLTAVLLDGESAVFFDNINHEMDSAELASAMTSPDTGYRARILGKTQTALVQIMSSWVFAANTLTMSDELLRRCILIDLDRKAVDPSKYVPEGGWRHKDVREWTREHRTELVHACLTIIQYWVTQGMQRSDDTLASFENWAGVMGGILTAAGVGGFMGNQDELTGLSDGRDDELASVVQAIAERMYGVDGARLYIGSKTDKETAAGKFGLFDILHAMDETPRLDQWGYREVYSGDSVEVEYHNRTKAGLRFSKAAKRTYRVEIDGKAYEARFVQEHDTRANAKCYRLDLTDALAS